LAATILIPSTIILLLLFLNNFSFEQTTKEQVFKTTVQNIVIAFSKQDSVTIAKYTISKIGLYQLDRIGVFDHYNHFKTLSFSDSTYPQVLFQQSKNIKLLSLKYSSLPTWNCDSESWSKKGLFVDTTKTDHLLSKICKYENKFRPDNIPDKTIQFFYDSENKSRRIVLYDNNGIGLVFYLSYLNDKWYLTIVDNVSSDCSA
jgi:hypothetical protein